MIFFVTNTLKIQNITITFSPGILLTLLTTSVFIKYNHTPVVKSSSRELSYTILIGTWQQLGPELQREKDYAICIFPLNQ